MEERENKKRGKIKRRKAGERKATPDPGTLASSYSSELSLRLLEAQMLLRKLFHKKTCIRKKWPFVFCFLFFERMATAFILWQSSGLIIIIFVSFD